MAALLMSCLPTQLDLLSKANIASFVDSCDTPLIKILFMRECRDDPVFLKDKLEGALIERYVDRVALSEYSNLALRAAEKHHLFHSVNLAYFDTNLRLYLNLHLNEQGGYTWQEMEDYVAREFPDLAGLLGPAATLFQIFISEFQWFRFTALQVRTCFDNALSRYDVVSYLSSD